MDRLSDAAIAIINNLHIERLEYYNEYLPLINAAQRLYEYEGIGLTPDEVYDLVKNVEARALLWFERNYGVSAGRMMELARADKEGRLKIVKKPPEGAHCGNCAHFARENGTARGTCKTQYRKRNSGARRELRRVSQSTNACAEFTSNEDAADTETLCERARAYCESGREKEGER